MSFGHVSPDIHKIYLRFVWNLHFKYCQLNYKCGEGDNVIFRKEMSLFVWGGKILGALFPNDGCRGERITKTSFDMSCFWYVDRAPAKSQVGNLNTQERGVLPMLDLSGALHWRPWAGVSVIFSSAVSHSNARLSYLPYKCLLILLQCRISELFWRAIFLNGCMSKIFMT